MNLKTPKLLLMATLSLSLFSACDGDEETAKPGTTTGTETTTTGDPNPTAVGTSLGQAVSQTIGPTGGTIQSPDESFTVTIPAGALSGSTTVTLQPLTNEAPNGIASAYRISADQDINDATLKLTLDEEKFASARGFKVAYQDSNNKGWFAKSGSQENATTRTVSATTGKFKSRDFAVVSSVVMDLVISPTDNHIVPIQPIKLRVLGVETLIKKNYPESTWISVSGLKALKHEEDGILAWYVNDIEDGNDEVGGISNAAYSDENFSGDYGAPVFLPNPNPVKLSVRVKTAKETVTLSNKVKIIQDNHITSSIGTTAATQAIAQVSPGTATIAIGDNMNPDDPDDFTQGLGIDIHKGFTGAQGSYNFTYSEDVEARLTDNVTREAVGRTYYYDDKGVKHHSGGSINITSFKKSETNQGFAVMEGTITGTAYFLKAGQYEAVPFTATFKCVSNSF